MNFFRCARLIKFHSIEIFIRTFRHKGYLLNILDQLDSSRTISDSFFFQKDISVKENIQNFDKYPFPLKTRSIVCTICTIFALKHLQNASVTRISCNSPSQNVDSISTLF